MVDTWRVVLQQKISTSCVVLSGGWGGGGGGGGGWEIWSRAMTSGRQMVDTQGVVPNCFNTCLR